MIFLNCSNPEPIRTADIRNKLQSFFTILERLADRKSVPKKIVSVAKKDLKELLKIL